MYASEKLTILLVDDDSTITNSLSPFLRRAGFRVIVKKNGKDALDSARSHRFDLIVLDVLMPVMDGREVLRHLRQKDIWIPTILLTQVGDAAERAIALEEGADDYLNKPFHPHELLARIRAVLRRVQKGQPGLSSAWKLTAHDVVINRRARRASIGDQPLDISPKAFALLEYLMTHPDEVINRERLLRSVWGWDYPVGTRTVDTRIFELRQALHDDAFSPKYIETLPGEGYCFIASVEILG
jgi:DNA-binding response OmpR family regulator